MLYYFALQKYYFFCIYANKKCKFYEKCAKNDVKEVCKTGKVSAAAVSE